MHRRVVCAGQLASGRRRRGEPCRGWCALAAHAFEELVMSVMEGVEPVTRLGGLGPRREEIEDRHLLEGSARAHSA